MHCIIYSGSKLMSLKATASLAMAAQGLGASKMAAAVKNATMLRRLKSHNTAMSISQHPGHEEEKN